MEKIYSVKELTTILGVPRVTVIRFIRDDKLRAFKLGGGRLWRIHENDLNKFLGIVKGGKQ